MVLDHKTDKYLLNILKHHFAKMFWNKESFKGSKSYLQASGRKELHT